MDAVNTAAVSDMVPEKRPCTTLSPQRCPNRTFSPFSSYKTTIPLTKMELVLAVSLMCLIRSSRRALSDLAISTTTAVRPNALMATQRGTPAQTLAHFVAYTLH
jgi:hypothetical protein